VSYELDVFGRVRNTLAGARAGEQASAGDVAALDLSVRAELASDYFTLRGWISSSSCWITRSPSTRGRSSSRRTCITRGRGHRRRATGASPVGVARTQAEETRLRRAQTEHAIAVLVGRQPADFSIAARSGGGDLPVPEVAPGLPSGLLERRPDVAAAERRVAAANAGIGVARAAYFPVFSLLGTAGVESTPPPTGSAPEPLLVGRPAGVDDALRRRPARGTVRRRARGLRRAVANYRGTVLTAFQDVEDNLAALRQLQRESVSQAAAVTATQGALDQANLRYKGGLVTYSRWCRPRTPRSRPTWRRSTSASAAPTRPCSWSRPWAGTGSGAERLSQVACTTSMRCRAPRARSRSRSCVGSVGTQGFSRS